VVTEFNGCLYHATSKKKYAQIEQMGLLPGAYLATKPIAEYYAETVADDGDAPVVLRIRFEDIQHLELEADHNGVAEPLTYTLKKSEDEILGAWGACAGSWKDSLEIIGSLRCMSAIPPEILQIVDIYCEDDALPDP
jgi:hypothetical protein